MATDLFPCIAVTSVKVSRPINGQSHNVFWKPIFKKMANFSRLTKTELANYMHKKIVLLNFNAIPEYFVEYLFGNLTIYSIQ